MFWKYVKEKTKTKAAINKVYTDNGSPTTNDKSTANVVNPYFASVFVKDEDAQLPVRTHLQLGSQLSNFTITDKDVDKVIYTINPSKSYGPDAIHPILLSKTADTIKTRLAKILNISLQENKIPETWKTANITPIHRDSNSNIFMTVP